MCAESNVKSRIHVEPTVNEAYNRIGLAVHSDSKTTVSQRRYWTGILRVSD